MIERVAGLTDAAPTPEGYVLDRYPEDAVNMTDPRQFSLRGGPHRILALTSLSWLVPVELISGERHCSTDFYVVASGQADLACRITHIPKARFA